MSRLKYDYSTTAHVVNALGGMDALEAVEAQVEELALPVCPFCGGEAVVALGSAYGQPTVRVECDRCHSGTVMTGPGYDYITKKTTDVYDAVDNAARRWSRRRGGAA